MSSSSSVSPEPVIQSNEKKGPKRKAGGTGKKGKTFMEDKSSLLSLVSGITSTKDAQAKSKVDKIKPLIKPIPPATGSNKPTKGLKGAKPMRTFGGQVVGEKKKSSASVQKRVEREKALENAKAAIIEKRKAKKARKYEREGGGAVPAVAVKPAKKVGFA